MIKKIAISVISILLALPAQAGVWTFTKNSRLEASEVDSAYRVPTLGHDVRVYEWTPKGNPNMICVMAFGSEFPVGMHCMPKVFSDEEASDE